MTTRPATRDDRARPLSEECVIVPIRFWEAVCVGWSIRMDWVRNRIPAELRRGCAVKSMRGERRMSAQIRAVKRKTPNCVIIAVP